MTIKGGLRSNIAVVKRFQTEKNLSPPEWQVTVPLEFRNRYGVRKPQWWGYKAEEKVLRYLYPFRSNTGVRRTATLRQQ